jgi:hypothetical protein
MPESPMPQKDADARAHRFKIPEATKLFLDELQETAAFATHKKYRLLMARLVKFSEQRGYVFIDQTGVRRMAMMKPFFEYCVGNKWMDSNPARAVKNPKGREMANRGNEQKLPFTDDEIKRMYEACRSTAKTYRNKWDGEDVAYFISLSIWHRPPNFPMWLFSTSIACSRPAKSASGQQRPAPMSIREHPPGTDHPYVRSCPGPNFELAVLHANGSGEARVASARL